MLDAPCRRLTWDFGGLTPTEEPKRTRQAANSRWYIFSTCSRVSSTLNISTKANVTCKTHPSGWILYSTSWPNHLELFHQGKNAQQNEPLNVLLTLKYTDPKSLPLLANGSLTPPTLNSQRTKTKAKTNKNDNNKKHNKNNSNKPNKTTTKILGNYRHFSSYKNVIIGSSPPEGKLSAKLKLTNKCMNSIQVTPHVNSPFLVAPTAFSFQASLLCQMLGLAQCTAQTLTASGTAVAVRVTLVLSLGSVFSS